MSTNTQTHWIVQHKPDLPNLAVSPQVRELMELGKKQSWDFAVLGQAPMPVQPVRLKEWLIVPAQQDTSQIPERALRRIRAIFAEGIRPKGFVLVHEAPMQLSATEDGGTGQSQSGWKLDPETTQKTIQTLSFGVTILGRVMAGALSLITTVILPAVFLTGAVLLDPILIAVNDDDTWIEIDRWMA